MTEQAALTALMRAVICNPFDNQLRLIFADALEENRDEARAEFVRCQLRLANLQLGERCDHDNDAVAEGEGYIGCTECELHRRERELLRTNIVTWADGLPDFLITKECPHCLEAVPDWETNAVECRQCDGTGIIDDYDRIEFRRGFVEQVACRLADWYGGACPRCDGRGGWVAEDQSGTTYSRDVTCPACHGSGRVGGHGPAIVAAAPVVEVRITDREPEETFNESDGQRVFAWWREGNGGISAQLPDALFELLIDRHKAFIVPRRSITVDDFDSSAAALLALSRALVTWARAEAQLPELTWRDV